MAQFLPMLFGFVKGVNYLELGLKYGGVNAIVFQSLKSYLFGKSLRVVEYPSGDLHTVIVRSNTLLSLRYSILQAVQGSKDESFSALRVQDIHNLSKYTAPQFSEPVRSMLSLNDGDWILWSRGDPIPRKGINLGPSGTMTDSKVVDMAIKFTETHFKPLLKPKAYSFLLDTIIDKDDGMLTIFRNFHDNQERCLKEVKRYIHRRHGTHHAMKAFPPTFFVIADEEEERRHEQEAQAQMVNNTTSVNDP